MKRLIASIALIAGLGIAGTGCELQAVSVCSNTKPVSSISLRGANVANGYATCDGVTSTAHYFWHIRLSDGARTYLRIVPR